MKKMIAASALALLMASPSIAETKTTEKMADGQYYTSADKSDFLASKLMGARVYATTVDVDASKEVDKVTADWKDIGEINNIIVGRDGAVKAVVLGVGGFLSIGEKDVAVRMSELKFVKKAGATAEDYFIVVNGSKESLEKAPAYKRTAG
ncbi:MAG: hypothetical protein ABL897_04535 [Hyphomicrobium sp.]